MMEERWRKKKVNSVAYSLKLQNHHPVIKLFSEAVEKSRRSKYRKRKLKNKDLKNKVLQGEIYRFNKNKKCSFNKLYLNHNFLWPDITFSLR